MFSATLDREVMALADQHIGTYEVVDVANEKVDLEHITQQLFYVSKRKKIELLKLHIKEGPALQTLIFTRTKRGADQLSKLISDMHIKVAVIHGDKSQHQRLRALQGFKAHKYEFLIATDVAARGLDIPALLESLIMMFQNKQMLIFIAWDVRVVQDYQEMFIRTAQKKKDCY